MLPDAAKRIIGSGLQKINPTVVTQGSKIARLHISLCIGFSLGLQFGLERGPLEFSHQVCRPKDSQTNASSKYIK